ncbi:hypothetical protein EYE40_00610 [Glaciihabitans arcticus]|uniref:Uncharacterized protein n=1 Tax=Glaciihabitans arcticus TaxID=2668039 RepID=A0A4Q9GSE5_9MICO|nr:hypothetical protein [Glaciihabitans arcticus]TBN56017.1 hypothetical protein EYE40_00610 [Glaciihabitans arcticus]
MSILGHTAKELATQYADPAWRERYSKISDLLQILGDCIIPNDYAVSGDINSALALSAEGAKMKDRLIRKEHIPAMEAHLMCALTFGHKELFIDVELTDVEKLASAISSQLVERKIRFPYSYGRDIYDAYSVLFEDEKDVLTLDETFRLIDEVPAGVFQYGTFVLGPYGILNSATSRFVHFSRQVPAFHCAQSTCNAVHPIRLTTGYDATINDERKKLHRILDEESDQTADWWGLALEVRDFAGSYYGDHHSGTVVALIGDCLSDTEFSSLLVYLLDSTKGAFREVVKDALGTGSARDMVAKLTRAEMQQIALLAEESWLTQGLDYLVRAGEIHIPKGEIRRPVTNIRRSSGAFNLVPELGHFGVRFVSSDPGFASLRERRLLHKLYLKDDLTDTEELDWQLRGFDSDDLDERLENFFRSTDPRSALRRMVLARKTNMIMACEEVGLEDGEHLSDSDLVETILWKLGFAVHFEDDPHGYFWDLHQRISALTQSSRISGIGESETFRGVASLYFTELEGLLIDSLAFGTWALLTDHTSEFSPFSYDNEHDRLLGLSRLQVAHDLSGNEHENFDFTSDKMDLYSLVRGFGILSKELARLEQDRSASARSAGSFPQFEGKTELKSFVFRSTVPYLDLTDASRVRLREGLSQITNQMISPVEVNQVRNDYSHYRRTSPEIDRMANALDAIGTAVREIENLGLARLLCAPSGFESDAWGRSQHKFSGPRSVEHLFARPSSYDWMGLPGLNQPQYIVRSAGFAEPNEVLRFTQRFESEFSRMWNGYPIRRAATVSIPVGSDEVDNHSENQR